jgi:signal transduction histidine kinase
VSLINEEWGRETAARRVLPLLSDMLGCETVGVFMVRGGRGVLVAAFGPTRKRGYPYPVLDLGDPFLSTLLAQPGVRVVSPRDIRGLPPALKAICCPRARCAVMHSIFTGHVLKGLLMVSSRSQPDATAVELLPVVADALGLSLGGAILSEASQAREVVLQSAAAAARGISGSLDLAETFRRIASAAAQATGDSRCLLLELDEALGDLVAVASSTDEDADLVGVRVRFEDEDGFDPLVSSRRIAVEDMQWGTASPPAIRERLNLRSVLVVPLRSERGAIGALLLYSVGRRTAFADDDVARAESIAEQAASAIRNAQLFRTLEKSEERSRLLLERITRLRTQQRLAVADTIHDDVLQTLVAALYELEAVAGDIDAAHGDSLERASTLMRSTIGEARTIIRELRPPVIDGLGFEGALRGLIDDTRGRWSAQVDLDLDDVDDLDAGLVAALYTVAREALQNARRHAGADKVTVTLRHEEGDRRSAPRVKLTIVDDGCGFDSDRQSGDHFGLKMMDEHVASLGGTLRVDSAPGCGSTVEAVLPVPRDERKDCGDGWS